MRDEKEERKKQVRSNKQTKQSNTAYPRQSLFLHVHVHVYKINSALSYHISLYREWRVSVQLLEERGGGKIRTVLVNAHVHIPV